MTHEQKLDVLSAALDLAYERLSEMKQEDMTTDTVAKLLQNIAALGYEHYNVQRAMNPESQCSPGCKCHEKEEATDAPSPKPDELPKHPATEEKDAPAEEKSQPALTLVQVRTRLADIAAVSGVDLPAVLAQFGASKLSEVDPAKYEELLTAAIEAAEA